MPPTEAPRDLCLFNAQSIKQTNSIICHILKSVCRIHRLTCKDPRHHVGNAGIIKFCRQADISIIEPDYK